MPKINHDRIAYSVVNPKTEEVIAWIRGPKDQDEHMWQVILDMQVRLESSRGIKLKIGVKVGI